MHFIVTGGSGFIGSHLTEQLLADGYRVTVVDNLKTGRLQNLSEHPRLRVLQKDIATCQADDFPDAIDGIAHLATTPSVTESWLYPLATHHNNLSAMISVIELCKVLKIQRLVFASSAAVYGNPLQSSVSETHPTHPLSPYGLQKLVAEQYVNLFAQQYHFSFVALRMFNVFGPRQLPNSPYSGVISIFLAAMQQGLPITIYGDGSQTRDFIYVKDVALAFVKALTVPLNAGTCVSCNIGTGSAISLLALIEILRPHFPDWQETIHFAPSRLGDILHSQADNRKAASILGFSPHWSVQTAMPLFLAQLVGTSGLHFEVKKGSQT